MTDFKQIANNLQDDTNLFMNPAVLYDVLPGINDSDIIKDVDDNDVWGNFS